MNDIIIVGAGTVGLLLAAYLAKNTSLRIAILDATSPQNLWSEDNYDPRVYAITPHSQCVLAAVEAWPLIAAKRISPFTHMQVYDAEGKGEISFNHQTLSVPSLGYIIEESLLKSALYAQVKTYSHVQFLPPATLNMLTEQEKGIELDVTTARYTAKLVIAADGMHSQVRQQCGIEQVMTDYQQTAIIAQVQTELAHQRTARQLFLPTGPLAFLPLTSPHQCSIVWSTSPQEAELLLKLDDSAFQEALTQAFQSRLGKIMSVSQRHGFPLYGRHAQAYVKNRIALIGDAAHTLHPLAGQGLNLGIADAASLAAVIIEATKKHRDYFSYSTLRRYERACKGNNAIMLRTVKMLKNLFISQHPQIQKIRSQGLNTLNRLEIIKNLFAHYAMG